MAARKRKDDGQASLFGAATPTYAEKVATTVDTIEPEPLPARRSEEPSSGVLPRTDEAPAPESEPRTELEHLATNYRMNWWVRPRPNGVTVKEYADGQFLIERVRDNGSTFSAWFATRDELEQLIARATEALR